MTRALGFGALGVLLLGFIMVVGTNVNVSSLSGEQEEVDLAINPTNPNHLVGGSNDVVTGGPRARVYVSANGGQTWTNGLLALPGSFTYAADPAIAFDRHGSAYYAYIAYNANFQLSLYVTKLAAGSTTWGAPALVPNVGADKEFMVVDTNPASPCVDTVYVAWDNNEQSGQTMRVSRSTNLGASFQSPPKVNDTGTAAIGAYPAVHPDGTVMVAWVDYQNDNILFDRSTDCGVTFGADRVVNSWTLPTSGLAYKPPAAPSRGVTVFPHLAMDLSSGPRRGRLYMAYTDKGSAATTESDVYVKYSDDKGTTWSPRVRVNDDALSAVNDQFLPRIAVDPSNGNVSVIFYDSRNDPGRRRVDIYRALSTNGTSFLPNERVSTASSDESGGSQMDYGEYIGLVALQGKTHAFWTDNRAGDQEVYSAQITDGLQVASVLPDATARNPYSATLAAVGGTPPYTWSATGLPASLTLNTSSGQITGTPTMAEVGTHSVTATARDTTGATASQTLTLRVVAPPPLVVATTTLPAGTVGTAYVATVSATGGVPPYAWAATGLPSPLALGASDGRVTGTPTTSTAGQHNVTFTVSDTAGGSANATLVLRISHPPLAITTTSLPGGGVGAAYSAQLSGTGGLAPYQWSATGLPSSLTLAASTGVLSGTPVDADAGNRQVTVALTDAAGATTSRTFTLAIASAPLVFSPPSLPTGQETAGFGPITLAASGGTAPLIFGWKAGYVAPSGLRLSAAGVVDGTPAVGTAGTHELQISVRDSAPNPQIQTAYLPLVIVGRPVADVGSSRLVDPGTHVLDGSSSRDPAGTALSFQWTGPSGVTLSDPTIARPSVTLLRAAAYPFSLRITNARGIESAPATLTLEVRNLAPSAVAKAPPTAKVQHQVLLDASESTDPNQDPLSFYWYSVAGGAQLSGLGGPITSFVPTQAGTYTFQVAVTDGTSTSTQNVSVVVEDEAPPSRSCGCTSTPLPLGLALGAWLVRVLSRRR